MRYSRLALIVIGPLLVGGMAAPSANWDRIAWTMTVAQARAAYPAAPYESPILSVDQAAIAKSSPLANLIEPDTRVLVHFTYEGGTYEDGFKADYVEFLVPGEFDAIAPKISAKYGKPVAGALDESACFDKDGQRIATDPSGVGHVLSLCQGFAVFVDRRAGNAIYLGQENRPDMFRKERGFTPYTPYATVRIGRIAACAECGGA